MTLDTSTEKCIVCGEEYPITDMDQVFFTKKPRYVCQGCREKGNREVGGVKSSYFNSYDGKRRMEFNRKKGKRR